IAACRWHRRGGDRGRRLDRRGRAAGAERQEGEDGRGGGEPVHAHRLANPVDFRTLPFYRSRMHGPAVLLMLILAGGSAAARERGPAAEIDAMVKEISPRNIEAIVRKLAGFGTRHTLSDATSETRGIGAARRWIAAELE